jgi:nucleoside-diphosphate-sugar epimerase
MGRSRLLIVGGAGYAGARLAEGLQEVFDVTVTVRTSTPERRAWLARTGIASVPFNSAHQSRLPVDTDFAAIVNLAMPSAAEAKRDQTSAVARALAAADASLHLLRTGGARRLIHFSTFHVYGGARRHYEEGADPAPIHPYGQTHLTVERLLLAEHGAPDVLVVRPTNLIGAPAHGALGDQGGLIFLDLCRQAAGGRMQLRNDGGSYRDILPLSDALAAVRRLVAEDRPDCFIYNLAWGKATRLEAIAKTIALAAPTHVDIVYGDGTDAFRAPFTVATDGLAALGWHPIGDIAAEAQRCISFFSGAVVH